jgi:hypothetical protein
VAAFDPSSAVPVDSAASSSSGFDPSSAQLVDDSGPSDDDGSLAFAAKRVAGLGARAALVGTAGAVGGVAQMTKQNLTDAFTPGDVVSRQQTRDQAAANPQPTAPAEPYKPQLSDFVHPDKWQQAAEYFADQAGLPKPETPTERVVSKAVEAVPTGAAMGGPAGAFWSAAGGAASQTTAEAGGGPVAQTLAGLGAGGLPAVGAGAAGGVRALTRGVGAQAGAAVRSRLANAAAADIDLTAGQATGSRLLQGVEGASSKFWGGGPIKATAEAQAEGIGSHVDRIVDNLSQGAAVSPTTAGEAINAGVAATKQSMKQAEQAAYEKVDALVPAEHPVDVRGTLAKLDALASPAAGAEATTGALVSPKLTALRDNLAADAAKNGGALPYSAVRQVRTAIGNNIDWGFAPADPVANAALKQAHGALGRDLDAATTAISPQAAQATKAASALYAANQSKRDLLNTIVDKSGGPEAVYQAATNGTKLGATKIGGVMGALDPQNQNMVRATVIDRLGRAIPSQQNAASNEFSADTFLTNWAKMSDEAKNALFGSKGSANSLRRSLDSLEDTASIIRKSTLYRNPGGTGEAVGHGFGLFALLEGGGKALFGHPAHLAALGGAIAGNAVLSRALVNPRTARWLAQTTKLPRSAIPNAVNQLSITGRRTNDPDASDLAAYLGAAM